MRQYDNVAFILSNYTHPKLMFLKLYAKYLVPIKGNIRDNFYWILIFIVGWRETEGGTYARYTRFVWMYKSKSMVLTFRNQVPRRLHWLKIQN